MAYIYGTVEPLRTIKYLVLGYACLSKPYLHGQWKTELLYYIVLQMKKIQRVNALVMNTCLHYIFRGRTTKGDLGYTLPK